LASLVQPCSSEVGSIAITFEEGEFSEDDNPADYSLHRVRAACEGGYDFGWKDPVDAGGTSFSYSKRKKNWKFKVTDKTVIRVGDKSGNLSDLKTGQPVKVEYQRHGNTLAALIIIGIGF
jgi:hypothetical protein